MSAGQREGAMKKQHPNDEVVSEPSGDEARRLSMGWSGALVWSGFICLWYAALQTALSAFVRHDPEARQELLRNVPLHMYRYSEAAFAVATVLNLLNCLFEDTSDKQQLGLLSAVIKGLSWHCDHLLVTGRAVVKFDYHGAIIMPSRYVQWSCSTPTMIFTLSRISNMDPRAVATTMAMDWLMVVTGYIASELPWWLGVWPLAVSFLAMAYVLIQLRAMIGDALREAGSAHARRCLLFTLVSTTAIWSLFPLGWVASHCLFMPQLAAWGEPLTMVANFSAKVVFSTSIMYNNFVTLAERRRQARLAIEHAERIQAVRDLSDSVGRKDAFLELVGHELRTPLNAICQLSAALAVGAGGPLAMQAREWMGTIKASSAHLLGVVNDILTFRAGQAAGIVLKQEVVSVAEVVDEVLRTLLPSSNQGVTLEQVMHARLPPIVADRRRLVLALTNLVANSIKFMDKTAGKVTVKAYPDRGGRHVIIKVVDNGPGLTTRQLVQLGDAALCSQVDSGKRRAGGLGLGVPITFQLVSAHGGVVRMTSPGLGLGTTALVRLPVLQATTDPALEHEFSLAYTSLGYNLEQLLSPDLAITEGRCLVAFTRISTSSAPTAPDSAPTPGSSAFAAPPLTGTAAPVSPDTPPLTSSTPLRPTPPSAPAHTPGTTTMNPVTGLYPIQSGHSPDGSNASSFDLGAADVQTYRWSHQQQQAAGGGGGGVLAAFLSQNAQGDVSAPMSANDSGPGSGSGCSPSISQRNSKNLPPAISGAASARGVPGQAIALMSSLFSRHPTSGAKPTASTASSNIPNRLSISSRKSFSNRLSLQSNRMSIEECDDEGQEEENLTHSQPLSAPIGSVGSVEVGTPQQSVLLTTTGHAGRYSVDVPMMSQSNPVATLSRLSEAAAAVVSSMSNAGGPIYVEAPEWDAYLHTADASAGASCRQESDAVVANDARLSKQYQQVKADADKKGSKVDEAWQTWVARIPDHHKVNTINTNNAINTSSKYTTSNSKSNSKNTSASGTAPPEPNIL